MPVSRMLTAYALFGVCTGSIVRVRASAAGGAKSDTCFEPCLMFYLNVYPEIGHTVFLFQTGRHPPDPITGLHTWSCAHAACTDLHTWSCAHAVFTLSSPEIQGKFCSLSLWSLVDGRYLRFCSKAAISHQH